MNSKEIVYLYDKTYFLGGRSKFNRQIIGVEGYNEFKKGIILPKKIEGANRGDFKNKNVLDLGYGRGELLKYCWENGAKNCVGVDYSPDAFKIASDFLKDTKVKLYNIAITEIDEITEDNFEVVYAMDILEHVSNEEWSVCLNKIKSKLNKKVVFIAETPSAEHGNYLKMHNNYHTKDSLHSLFDVVFNGVEIKEEARKKLYIIKCKDLKDEKY